MKINYWKAVAIVFAGILCALVYSSRHVAAQSEIETSYYYLRTVGKEDLLNAPTSGSYIRVAGKEIKGFSCITDIGHHLERENSDESGDVRCYILSK